MSDLLNSASLVLIPSGYKEDTVYSVVPSDGSGDLSFTRASNGTRVNSAGLVETASVLGSELVTNGNFATDTNWSKSANVSISGGQATFTANGANQSLIQTNAWAADSLNGKKVKLTYTIISNSLNAGNFNLGGFTGASAFNIISLSASAGTYSIILDVRTSAGSDNAIDFWISSSSTSGTLVIDNVSIKEVITNNVPRLDYSQGSCPSLLLEPQRTNLTLYSEDFSNAAFWAVTNSGTISANNEISPDGTQNADTLNAGAAFSQVQGAIGGTIGTVYTVSIYVKRISGTGNVFLRAVENVNTLISVTNEWQRFTATVTSTSTVIRIGITLATSGDAVAIWGGQIEVGAYPTTYIPTTTASATRVADSFARNNIYTNGLITSSGGTWFVELKGNVIYGARDGNEGIGVGDTAALTTNSLRLFVNTSGTVQVVKYVSSTLTTLISTSTSTVKIAIKWNGTSADVFINGSKVVTATAFTTTNMEWLVGNAGVPFFVSQMDLFPTPLTDAECIALTTL
jgi:cytochrome c-type biogenesis protein CcmE